MEMARRRLVGSVVLALIVSLALSGCGGGGSPSQPAAQPSAPKLNYPTKPVEFVVPYAPGGGSDNMARMVNAIIESEKLVGQAVTVVNKDGGSGGVGLVYTAGKKGDTHTIMTAIDSVVITPIVNKIPASWKNLTPIAVLAIDEQMLVVGADSPYKKIEDLLKFAKENPGKLKIGGTGTGAEDTIMAAMVEKATGAKFTYIPFNSGGQVMTNLLGGHVDVAVANPNEAISQITGKKAIPLAVTGTKRLDALNDTPTFKEKGFDVNINMFRGVMAPADMPADVVKYWEDVFRKVTQSEKWKKDYVEKQLLSPNFVGSTDFKKLLEERQVFYEKTLKDLGLAK